MSDRPEYWPDDADLESFGTPRAMCRAFVRNALDAGERPGDIPNLVYRHIPTFGTEHGQDVLNEMRGLDEPMEEFM